LQALQARIVAATSRPPVVSSLFGFWDSLLERLGLDLTPAQLWPSLAGLSVMTVLGFAVGINGLIDNSAQTTDADDTVVVSSIDFTLGSPSP
jgi:hypothetical protein